MGRQRELGFEIRCFFFFFPLREVFGRSGEENFFSLFADESDFRVDQIKQLKMAKAQIDHCVWQN